MHSTYFYIVNRYYNVLHFYTIDDVRAFVVAGKITEEEFKEITGKDY